MKKCVDEKTKEGQSPRLERTVGMTIAGFAFFQINKSHKYWLMVCLAAFAVQLLIHIHINRQAPDQSLISATLGREVKAYPLNLGEVILEEEEVFGEIEVIKQGRESLSDFIAQKADKELKDFGITVIDVQLRRIAYEESVEKKVYERMISERKRIAEKIRSIGEGEKAKIEGKTSRDLQRIQAEGYRKAEIIKGKAQGTATRIYAKAMGQDANFYEFIRTMDAYKKALKDKTHYILSTDSDFLRKLKKP